MTLRTAVEVAMAKPPFDDHAIPPITHPLGEYWDQPDRSRILIDGVNAMMDKATFDSLHEYSCSMPTGVYEGKMWKRGEPYVNPTAWYLMWFGKSKDPDCCSINHRAIIIA